MRFTYKFFDNFDTIDSKILGRRSFLNLIEEIKEIILDLTDTDILWVDTEVADYKTSHPRLSLIQVLAYPQDTRGDRAAPLRDRTYMIDVLDKPEVAQLNLKCGVYHQPRQPS